ERQTTIRSFYKIIRIDPPFGQLNTCDLNGLSLRQRLLYIVTISIQSDHILSIKRHFHQRSVLISQDIEGNLISRFRTGKADQIGGFPYDYLIINRFSENQLITVLSYFWRFYTCTECLRKIAGYAIMIQ